VSPPAPPLSPEPSTSEDLSVPAPAPDSPNGGMKSFVAGIWWTLVVASILVIFMA
jgi:hypothetical protein